MGCRNVEFLQLYPAISHMVLYKTGGIPKVILIHCGLIMPYGDLDQGQYWIKPPSEPMLTYHQ